jgi:hypothetical protein
MEAPIDADFILIARCLAIISRIAANLGADRVRPVR